MPAAVSFTPNTFQEHNVTSEIIGFENTRTFRDLKPNSWKEVVPLHLPCKAKYLIKFHFTRGGPVIAHVSKSDVELPSFFSRSFFKGKTWRGTYPRKLNLALRDLVWGMSWLVQVILCLGQSQRSAPLTGPCYSACCQDGKFNTADSSTPSPWIFSMLFVKLGQLFRFPLGISTSIYFLWRLEKTYFINVPLIFRHMPSALILFPWRLRCT